MVLYKNITIVPNWPKKRQTSVTMIFLKWDSGGEGNAMNSGLSPNFDTKYPDSIGAEVMSIALIGPDEERRKAVSRALAECRGAEVREFSSYPTTLDDVPRLLRQHYDVILIDLDSNREFALELVESICATDSATVMVYAEMTDRDRVFRSMRAGAREFLTPPFDQNTLAEALVRAAAILRPRTRPTKRTGGRQLVFFGSKGGSGVTTIACNFAIALAQESDQSTLLIDLGLPIGDAALSLGITAEYSTDNALQDTDRLDGSFLLKLLAKHQSGVSVLAAPSKVPEVEASVAAIEKLIAVARQEFDQVIVDVGSRVDLMGTALFKEASTVYLVTMAGISELRNSNRLISRFFSSENPKLEIVINRFEPRFLGASEEHITKALNRPAQWKIPSDYDAMRQMQSTNTPLSLADSPVSRLFLEMACSVTGHPVPKPKRKVFSFRDLGKGSAESISVAEKPPAVINTKPAIAGAPPTVTWKTPAPITCGAALSDDQLNATASVPGTFVYTPSTGYELPAGKHTLWVTFTPTASAGDFAAVQSSTTILVSKATPTITWAAPRVIPCGAVLSNTQLNAKASVPGTFDYTPAAGEVLVAGKYMLSVTFTPTDESNYTTVQATVPATVAMATPAIAWSMPDPIICGTALCSIQLNARASVPGTFDYTPEAGELLPAGTHTLSVIFTPTESANYETTQASVSITVIKATPGIAWSTPDPITYGTRLSTAQLSATASVTGEFNYTPGAGALLAAGEHTPSVIFTPTDTSNYTKARAAISLIVAKAVPVIAWPTPDPMSCGTALSANKLNATASVPGTFVYTPAAGEVPPAGAHTLSVAFTPADTMNYKTARASALLVVTETTPTLLRWPAPSAISYGTALSSLQLNATAPIQGTFVYSPSAGDLLTVGRHTLSVTFTPADTEKYATAQAAVTLVVEGLPNIDSLLTAAVQTPFAQTRAADHANFADARRKVVTSVSTPNQKGQRETRTYKGATYEKREDGQWHLQQK
jgi:Flp pilus assembly CpaE family ATPase